MRIHEIAIVEHQTALFKLITDKVWQAFGAEQRADAEAKAASLFKLKLKLTNPKKPKLPAARTVSKLATRASTPTIPKTQPARTQFFGLQSQNIQA